MLYSQQIGQIQADARSVPLVAILATPSLFNDKLVRVHGLLSFDENGSPSLSVSSEGHDMLDYSSRFTIVFDESVEAAVNAVKSKISGAYVVLEGRVLAPKSSDGIANYPISIIAVNWLNFRGRPIPREVLIEKLDL